MCDIIVLYDGYSILKSKEEMIANCSCTLVKSSNNIIIDTMTAWDGDRIVCALKLQNLSANDINYVVSTHGHSDHIGNNNLFLRAKHIVGFSVSHRDYYTIHPFDEGQELVIDEYVKIIPTPGHTLSDITVLATSAKGVVAITGDLFEKFEDVNDPSVWIEAGSEDPIQQRLNRLKVAQIADWIVPGHGPQFKVTVEIREILKAQVVK